MKIFLVSGLSSGLMTVLATLLCAGFATAGSNAADINVARAHFNYQMFCQGCHTPDGVGGESVPRMKGYIGHFMTFPEGREFLVRVPGSANSSLDNEQLAEVLNWMILQFGQESIPADMKPYESDEVGRLRQNPLNEVDAYRATLVEKFSKNAAD